MYPLLHSLYSHIHPFATWILYQINSADTLIVLRGLFRPYNNNTINNTINPNTYPGSSP